ncbi:MAG TPA: dephospho-CoA kinase [Chitinophagaceae bacterium]|nr:dephospho-CoA kinase [Chitinophagaceae bacterium]
MVRVGLTGGIGSGKSTVAHVFEILGIPVYYADKEAKRLMNEDPEIRTQLVAHFGEETYADNLINRRFLAEIVFKDKEKLQLLNSLVHPITIARAEEWMQKHDTPYVIKEAALIFESGSQENLDYVIGVSAPLNLRIQRTMKRDGVSREEVLNRMQHQIQESIKMRLCDFVIRNDEQHLVLPQVLAIHEKLKRLAVGAEKELI